MNFKFVGGDSNTTSNAYTSYGTHNEITILRINDVIYYKKDNENYQELIDLSSLTYCFDTPVTFGCALDENNSPFRYFKGRLSNMHVIVDDNLTLE